MKSSPILPLLALCALSLQPSYAASAAPPPSASSSYWDHIVGGPGTNAAVWYVPTASLTNVGVSVCNTIPHSTMGDLVVGNYDLTTNTSQPIPNAGTGNAFIYHITSKTWTILAPTNAGTAPSGTTAYGIWQNGSNSSFYTIAGGASSNGTNTAFLVDYNADTRTFNNLTYFADTNTPGFTHFEGITGRDGGYNLIATTANGPAVTTATEIATGDAATAATTVSGVAAATSPGTMTQSSPANHRLM